MTRSCGDQIEQSPALLMRCCCGDCEHNENSEDGENSEGGDDSEDGEESEVTEIKFASDPKSTVNWEYAHTDERQGTTFAYHKIAHREAI